jgi:hypothetical protein
MAAAAKMKENIMAKAAKIIESENENNEMKIHGGNIAHGVMEWRNNGVS